MKKLAGTLSKEQPFRTGFGSQHLKASQILAKSPWERFYHVLYLSQGIWFRNCLSYWWMKSYGCLLTRWLPMTNIVFKIPRIWHSQFKRNSLKKEKLFLNFLFYFWNLHQILNILKKRMIVIANVFRKLHTVKKLARILSKEQRFRTRFGSQDVKASQILAKSPWEHFYHVFLHSDESWFRNCLP